MTTAASLHVASVSRRPGLFDIAHKFPIKVYAIRTSVSSVQVLLCVITFNTVCVQLLNKTKKQQKNHHNLMRAACGLWAAALTESALRD